jgi:hypothetical protein
VEGRKEKQKMDNGRKEEAETTGGSGERGRRRKQEKNKGT